MLQKQIILFKTKYKPCDTDLRLKLCRKRLYVAKYLRYLRKNIFENFNWKCHIHDLTSELNRANSVLAKLRHFVNSEILISTYFAIFYSHLNNVCIAWGFQDFLKKKCLFSKKALKIMNFAPFNAHTTAFFKNCNVLKFDDIINVESCNFINICFNKDSFTIFNENFKLVSAMYWYIIAELVMDYFLYRLISQSDLEENQLSIQLHLHGIIFKTSQLNIIFLSFNILLVIFLVSEHNS